MTVDEAAATVRDALLQLGPAARAEGFAAFNALVAAAQRADRLAEALREIVGVPLDEALTTEKAISKARIEMRDIAGAALADGAAG